MIMAGGLGKRMQPFTSILPKPLIPINGKPVIINIFASWCAPCRIEHKVLKSYSEKYDIVGIAYKDSEENVNKFLMELGNPYEKIFYDYRW